MGYAKMNQQESYKCDRRFSSSSTEYKIFLFGAEEVWQSFFGGYSTLTLAWCLMKNTPYKLVTLNYILVK